MLARLHAITVLFLVACSGGAEKNGADGGTSDVADAAPTQPDARPATNCSAIPALPATNLMTRSWNASEDFTFDAAGNLWGVSIESKALTRFRKDGTADPLIPNISEWGRGIRFLPGGDMVLAEPTGGFLLRITPAGVSSRLLSGVQEPNGVAVHLNGTVYLTSGGGTLYRVDPATGNSTTMVTGEISFDGIAFSRDYRTLYYNTEGGQVYSLAVDADGNATGSPQNYAQIPEVMILDGMTLDDCDNLYVVEMGGIVWRVTPEGVLEKVVDFLGGGKFGTFISAVNFGSGVGGWDAKTLYIMDLGGQIHEAYVGVQSKPEPHLP